MQSSHVLSVIPCLFSLPTEPSPEGLQLVDYVCAGGTDILKFDKNPLIYNGSYFNFGGLVAFLGAKPTKAPVATGLNTSISKTVLPNHTSWAIGFLDAQQ